MTATVTNSKPQRRQLSDQLDRLDVILDGLSEGLSGAVADATREGTRLAVKDAIVEIMTDATLRSRLHEATGPEPSIPSQPPEKQGFWARIKAKATQTAAAVSRAAYGFADGAVRAVRTVADCAAGGLLALKGLGRFTKLALFGMGGGIVASVAGFLAPRVVREAAGGVKAWSRRACRALTMI